MPGDTETLQDLYNKVLESLKGAAVGIQIDYQYKTLALLVYRQLDQETVEDYPIQVAGIGSTNIRRAFVGLCLRGNTISLWQSQLFHSEVEGGEYKDESEGASATFSLAEFESYFFDPKYPIARIAMEHIKRVRSAE